MIISAHGLDPDGPLQADLCIIGAGPAGIAIALQFLGTRTRVIMLESGGRRPDAHSQALCGGEVTGPHPPADRYRRRGLGGSSTVWGGRCAPLDRLDFAPRPWLGLNDGWPIAYDDLQPFWPRAAALAELGGFDFDAATAIPGGMRPMFHGFNDDTVSAEGIERFSRPTDFGTAYGPALERSETITVLLHAVCQRIDLAPDGATVREVQAVTEGGGHITVQAGAVILAAGGLDTPRLLLASTAQMRCGIGNQYDQVGRHYMCHMAGTIGVFTPTGAPPFHGYDRAAGGVYCRRRLAIKPWAQQAYRIGNAIARLHHPRIADPAHRSGPLSALYLARRALPYEYTVRLAGGAEDGAWRHALNIARDPLGTTGFAARLLWGRTMTSRAYPSITVAPRAGRFTLDVHAEQLPNPLSRVTLSRTRDAFGLPQPRIDWRHLPADIATVRTTLALIGNALNQGGHGALQFDPDQVEAELLRDGAYGGHHLGTTRMAADPRCGVVDADSRVHGIENLFVAGGAVFATSGQANPTLTILALALRLAAHVQARLATAPVIRAAPWHAPRQAAVLSV